MGIGIFMNFKEEETHLSREKLKRSAFSSRELRWLSESNLQSIFE
jgi:hypothetical protein